MAEPKFIRDNGCKEAVCVDAGRVYDSCCEGYPTSTNRETETALNFRAVGDARPYGTTANRAVGDDARIVPLGAFTHNLQCELLG